MRFRTAWALTIASLVLIAGSEFLFQGTWQVGIAGVVLVLWMFWKRAAFDRPFSREAVQADLEEWKKRREKKRAQAEAERNHVGKRSTDEARADEANAAKTPTITKEDSDVPDISGWEENVKRGRNLSEEYIATSGVTIPDVDSPEAK